MDKRVFIQLNGDRKVTGVLRGFDPFMNLVLDEAIEETNPEKKNSIGMVVSTIGRWSSCDLVCCFHELCYCLSAMPDDLWTRANVWTFVWSIYGRFCVETVLLFWRHLTGSGTSILLYILKNEEVQGQAGWTGSDLSYISFKKEAVAVLKRKKWGERTEA